jgi:O-antigen/teichoic acid export membrane protein
VPAEPSRSRIQADATAVVAGSLAAGLGAYAFQVIGTRALGEQAYAPIGVLWTIQYLTLTVVIASAEAYLIRTITLHQDDAGAARRAVVSLIAWLAAVAVGIATASYVWREQLFDGAGRDLWLAAGLTVLSYGLFAIVRGRLAGASRFDAYGLVTGMESLARVAMAVPVVLLAPTTRALAWTLPIGPLSVGVWWLLVGRRLHAAAPRHSAEPIAGFAAAPATANSARRYLAATTVANAAAQTLLASGPLVLIPLGADRADISVFFITITAARIPLVFAFGGLLSRILPPLTRAAAAGQLQRLRRFSVGLSAGAVAVATVAAVTGAVVGPRLIVAFFGAAFEPTGRFVALTAAGMVGATAALFLNQLLIAMQAETRLVGPWLLAVAAGAAPVALGSGSPSLRVITGFVVGEAVALAGLLATVLLRLQVPATGRVEAGALSLPLDDRGGRADDSRRW